MNILVACEFSGFMRDAFKARGHYVWSCDLEPTERAGLHFQNDVRIILNEGWDMMIAHPPCTYLSFAGLRWDKVRPERLQLRQRAIEFFMLLLSCDIPRICIENPCQYGTRNHIVPVAGKPTQVIEPYWFGASFTKATGLWLKGLPELQPTSVHPNPFRNATKYRRYLRTNKDRSRTYPGVAQAMSEQWG